MFTIEAGTTEFLDQVVANVQIDALQKLRLTLEQVGIETIAYLRSLADPPEYRPGLARSQRTGRLYQPGPGPHPRTVMEPQRRAHPGHWADRSSQLAASYDPPEVIVGPNSVMLVLRNHAEYALYVEAMDGFFVLSGVTDPGGPVDIAFRAVAARLAPEWEVVIEPGQAES